MTAKNHPARFLLAATALLLAALAAACGDPKPLVVGFSGPLEGKFSDVGVQGRNGLQLAIETVNAAGGVLGRPLMMVARDDGIDAQDALRADRELMDAGARVIVGHMLSGQTVAALPQAREAGVTMISPTTATQLLSGIEDNFFRVIPTSTQWSRALAEYCLHTDHVASVACVTDMDNEAYAAPFNESFAQAFAQGGGHVLGDVRIRSSQMQSWATVVDRLQALAPEAVQVAISARDLAALAREMRHAGMTVPIYSAMWAYTRELIQAGGKAAEGIVFAVSYSGDNTRPEFLDFQKRYKDRFGWKPSFSAAFGYECGMLLAEGLRRAGGDPAGLPRALAGIRDFPGVVDAFSMDQYGDVIRPTSIVTITGREFKTIATVDPS